MRTGIANSPLHYGKAPAWLFEKMKDLARELTLAVVSEIGPREMLLRLSDPFWFQAFGCVLGFDWHSSGLTTTSCGALKEGLKGLERETGFFVAGGKGRTSRQTPLEIERRGDLLTVDPATLTYASRMAAKVDSAAVQDGYQLYHHCFFYTADGHWTVVQQGMNEENRFARRYHWLSDTLESFVKEPHKAVCCDATGKTLNMVATESEASRQASVLLVKDEPKTMVAELKRVAKLDMPARHDVRLGDLSAGKIERIVLKAHESQPKDFEQLLGTEGVGAKTIRALSLIGELLYGSSPSFEDPARYSFAHGGKDGHPYPVDRENYQQSIDILQSAVRQSKIGQKDKLRALERLAKATAQNSEFA